MNRKWPSCYSLIPRNLHRPPDWICSGQGGAEDIQCTSTSLLIRGAIVLPAWANNTTTKNAAGAIWTGSLEKVGTTTHLRMEVDYLSCNWRPNAELALTVLQGWEEGRLGRPHRLCSLPPQGPFLGLRTGCSCLGKCPVQKK